MVKIESRLKKKRKQKVETIVFKFMNRYQIMIVRNTKLI